MWIQTGARGRKKTCLFPNPHDQNSLCVSTEPLCPFPEQKPGKHGASGSRGTFAAPPSVLVVSGVILGTQKGCQNAAPTFSEAWTWALAFSICAQFSAGLIHCPARCVHFLPDHQVCVSTCPPDTALAPPQVQAQHTQNTSSEATTASKRNNHPYFSHLYRLLRVPLPSFKWSGELCLP